MKNRLPAYLCLFLLALSSCKKGGTINPDMVSNLQAANMVAYALAVNSNGFSNLKTDVITNAQTMVAANTTCGTATTSSLARQEPSASLINYNYALNYNYIFNCVNNIADNIDGNITFDGSYDAAAVSTVNSGGASINVSGLAASTLLFTLNGTYNSSGTFQTNTDSNLAGSNSVTLALNGITVKKSNRAFSGGSATVNVSGNVSNRSNFSYNGSVIFTGNGNATLTLEGYIYVINLTTAIVTAQ